MRRITVADVARLKAEAKAIKADLRETGRIVTLSTCQSAVAAALGFDGLKELVAHGRRVANVGDLLPATAEDADRPSRVAVLVGLLGIDQGTAEDVLTRILPGSLAGDDFPHLGLATEYSLGMSCARIDDVVATATSGGIRTVALADLGTLGAALDIARKGAATGLSVIQGIRLDVDDPHRFSMTLLARSAKGWARILAVVAAADCADEVGILGPMGRQDLDRLLSDVEGLVCLVGPRRTTGDTVSDNDFHAVVELLRRPFGSSLRIELRRDGTTDDAAREASLLAVAARAKIPVVAVVDVARTRPDEIDVLGTMARVPETSLRSGDRIAIPQARRGGAHLLCATDAMALFADLPAAIAEARAVASACRFRLDTRKIRFSPDMGRDLREVAFSALDGAAAVRPDLDTRERRVAIEREVAIHERNGTAWEILAHHDLLSRCRAAGIEVGPGRGPAAGSALHHVLGIVDVDPFAFGLLSECALPDGVSSSSRLEIDYERARRPEAIDLLGECLPTAKVVSANVYSRRSTKAAVVDAARILGLKGKDEIASALADLSLGHSLADAYLTVPRYRTRIQDEDLEDLHRIASLIEGRIYAVSVHDWGRWPLFRGRDGDLVPVTTGRGGAISQFSRTDLESLGIARFAFLGLRQLDGFRDAWNEVSPEVDRRSLPMDDNATMSVLCRGWTEGMFQLASDGMRRLLVRAGVETFEDVVACNTVHVPIPNLWAVQEEFGKRRFGKRVPSTGNSRVPGSRSVVDPILADSRGFLIYHEQATRLIQAFSGWSMAQAEVFRRGVMRDAFGRLEEFQDAAQANGIPRTESRELVDILAAYPLKSKAHSVAYAMIDYRLAWIRSRTPRETWKIAA